MSKKLPTVAVTYLGPHDEVEIPRARKTCRRGETIEVPPAFAEGLLAQPTRWAPATKPATPEQED